MTARDLTDELLDKLTVIYMRGTLRGKCEGCPETRKTITLVLAKQDCHKTWIETKITALFVF